MEGPDKAFRLNFRMSRMENRSGPLLVDTQISEYPQCFMIK
jgi:hypothetical protein